MPASPKASRQAARWRREAHELRKQGLPVKEVARRVGKHWSQVYRALRGAEPPDPGRPDPAVGEPNYSRAESEFLAEVSRFRQEKNRPFMTATEYFEVLTNRMGYRRP